MPRKPSASARAFSWSSASRSTLCSNAYRQAAASTPACRHQAFAIGQHALGLQCHPELDARQFERWLIGHTLELAQAGIAPNDLRAQARRYGAPLAAAATAMFAPWLQDLPEIPR
ncbi:hypothetical protein G6F59_018537 [Rhizopus arrhizus]|nr:hypothetical protein G6F59_018537 [Rhizopus arrhizus]